jgi:hypothetical protein
MGPLEILLSFVTYNTEYGSDFNVVAASRMVDQFEELQLKALPLYLNWPHSNQLLELLKGG